jgi:hypothetical protein
MVHEETPLYATQHIYPLAMLLSLARPSQFTFDTDIESLPADAITPSLVSPTTRLTRYFLFPTPADISSNFTIRRTNARPQVEANPNNTGENVLFQGLVDANGIAVMVPIVEESKLDGHPLQTMDVSQFPGLQNPFESPW